MLKIITIGLVSFFIIGCGNNTTPSKLNKIVDTCGINYQKCKAECKITTLNKADWKKTACEAKCKTIYLGCKTKQKTIQGYKYIKEKVIK